MKSGFFRRLTAEILACGMILTSGSMMVPANAYAGESETVLVGVGADGTTEAAASASTESPQTQAASETAAPATEAQTAAPATEQQTAAPATEATTSESIATEAPASATTETGSTATEAPASEPGTEAKATEATEPTTTETASEKESESESETEEQVTYNNTSLAGNDAAGRFTVELQYDASAQIPDGSTLKITDLAGNADSYNNYLNAAEATFAPSDDTKIVYADFLDITIIDKKGNKIEPKASVNVKISLASSTTIDADEIKTIHFPDAGGAPEEIAYSLNSSFGAKRAMAARSASAADSSITLSSVSFSASSFSVYGVIGTETDDKKARATYEFYDSTATGAKLVSTQIVKTGDTLVEPTVPNITDSKQFAGWYTADGTQVSFTDAVTVGGDKDTTIKVYPKLTDAYIATFYDVDKVTVITRKVVTKNSTGKYVVDTTDVPDATPADNTSTFAGWLPDGVTTLATSYEITADTNFYPSMTAAKWIKFDTNAGSDAAGYVAPQLVKVGDTPTEPEYGKNESNTPRTGYKFTGWYTSATTQDSTTKYDFTKKITSSDAAETTLYAGWEAQDTTYKIIYWKQSLSGQVGVAATIPDGYDYYDYTTGTATTGSTVNVNDLTVPTPNSGDLVGFHLRDPQPDTAVVINGDGSSVVNVYYDRNVITFTFQGAGTGYTYTKTNVSAQDAYNSSSQYYGMNSNGNYIRIYARRSFGWLSGYTYYWSTSQYGNGTTYTGDVYTYSNDLVMTGLYGQPIDWPSAGNNKLWQSNQGKFPYMGNYQPVPTTSTSMTFNTSNVSDAVSLRFFFQTIDENGNPIYSSSPTEDTYVSGSSNWNTRTWQFGETFNGYDVDKYEDSDGNNKTVTQDEVVDLPYASDGAYFNIYYKLKQYKIQFKDSRNGSVLSNNGTEMSYQEYYGAPISKYNSTAAPTAPEGYSFGGWYKDQACTQAYTFSGTMPANDIQVFAKWVPITTAVTVNLDGGTLTPITGMTAVTDDSGNVTGYTITVPYGTTISKYLGALESATKTDYDLIGWNNGDAAFNFDTPITDDITITAQWKYNRTIQVKYIHPGDGITEEYSNVADSKKYEEGATATVVTAKPDSPVTSSGKTLNFIGWQQVDQDGNPISANVILKPNTEFTVSADYAKDVNNEKVVYLKAVFSEIQPTTITLYPNAKGASISYIDDNGQKVTSTNAVTVTLAQNEALDLGGFTGIMAGCHLIGWAKSKDATKAYYKTSDSIAGDGDGTSNHVYAVWGANLVVSKEVTKGQYVNSGKKFGFQVNLTYPDNTIKSVTFELESGQSTNKLDDDNVKEALSYLPVGTKYTVTETTETTNFKTSYKINNGTKVVSVTTGEQTLNSDSTVAFTNESKIVPTGVDINTNAIMVSVLLISLMGAAYVILASKRSKERR